MLKSRCHLMLLIIPLLFLACENENNAFVPVAKNESQNIVGPSGIADSSELKYFIKRYIGHVGDLEIFMLMANWGNGYLHGRHDYTKYGVPLDFNGKLKSNGQFILTETRNDLENAWFEGKFDGTTISGTWWNVDRSVSKPFELQEYRSTIDALGWTGVWHLNDVWHLGKLIIGDATDKQFDFILSINSNNNKGEIYGTADILSENRAVFDMRIIPDLPEKCKLVFIRSDDFVKVEQHCFPFLCGFERIAYADGKYYDIFHEKKAELSYGDPKDAVFKSKDQLDAFIDLVGQKNYDSFAYTMQTIKVEAVPIPEQRTARVHEGALKGLQGRREAIIMQDSIGNIWAALVTAEEKKRKMKYFTNVESMHNRIPAYFKEWKTRFSNLEINYASSK